MLDDPRLMYVHTKLRKRVSILLLVELTRLLPNSNPFPRKYPFDLSILFISTIILEHLHTRFVRKRIAKMPFCTNTLPEWMREQLIIVRFIRVFQEWMIQRFPRRYSSHGFRVHKHFDQVKCLFDVLDVGFWIGRVR